LVEKKMFLSSIPKSYPAKASITMAAEDASRLNAMGAEFMRDYFDKNPYFVTAHHLDSFDSFLNELPPLVRSMNPISMVRDDTMTAAVTMTNQVDRYTVNMYVGEDGVSFDHPVITDKRKASEPRRGRGKDKDSASEGDPSSTGTTRPLYPSEARLRDLTYGINIYADLRIEYTKNGEPAGVVKYPKVNIGFLPLLVHSSPCYLRNMDSATLSDINECAYDRGGYFIIDGREKVVVSQEERVINRL
jgi:DNA-directed RNA polymerase beta subunit